MKFSVPSYLWYYLAGIAIWSAWLIIIQDSPKNHLDSWYRASVRIGVLAIPAFFDQLRGKGLEFHFQPKGWLMGIGLSILYLVGAKLVGTADFLDLTIWPTEGIIWGHFILISPFMEEVWFRGIILKAEMHNGKLRALLISSMLFMTFHIPQWMLQPHWNLTSILNSCTILFLFGIAFGGLYLITKSIIACFLPHATNNLIAEMALRTFVED